MIKWLKQYTTNVKVIKYQDHYKFGDDDIKKIKTEFAGIKGKGKFILTTEKDAMRIREIDEIGDTIKNALFYVPVEVNFVDGKKEKFDKDIINYVKHKRKIGQLIY